MHLLALLLAFIPTASAYPPEVPLFEQTEFREEYGMFRWYQGCWFRVRHNYAYIICSPDGRPVDRVPLSSIPELIESGLLPADSMTGRLVDRLFGRANTRTPANYRLSAGRTTAAPGDGTRLSDLFGGGTSGFSGFSGFDGLGSLGSGVFQFDGIGSFNGSNFGGFSGGGFSTGGSSNGFRFSNNGGSGRSGFDGFSNVNRFAPRENDGATFRFSSGNNSGNGLSGGGDGTAGGNGEGPLGQPLGFGCTDINDTQDGGMLGPIPCTSYPGVLGPVPRY
jgi:hypothetical protein